MWQKRKVVEREREREGGEGKGNSRRDAEREPMRLSREDVGRGGKSERGRGYDAVEGGAERGARRGPALPSVGNVARGTKKRAAG